jgi:hypothetical protein
MHHAQATGNLNLDIAFVHRVQRQLAHQDLAPYRRRPGRLPFLVRMATVWCGIEPASLPALLLVVRGTDLRDGRAPRGGHRPRRLPDDGALRVVCICLRSRAVRGLLRGHRVRARAV